VIGDTGVQGSTGVTGDTGPSVNVIGATGPRGATGVFMSYLSPFGEGSSIINAIYNASSNYIGVLKSYYGLIPDLPSDLELKDLSNGVYRLYNSYTNYDGTNFIGTTYNLKDDSVNLYIITPNSSVTIVKDSTNIDKPIIIIPYIFNSKPIDSGYISSSPAIGLRSHITTSVVSSSVDFIFDIPDIHDLLLNTLNATRTDTTTPEYTLAIYIVSMAEGGGDFVLGNDADILFDNTDIGLPDLNGKTVNKTSYGATSSSPAISFNLDTQYKYYIFLTYTDRSYNIIELFITSKTFTILN